MGPQESCMGIFGRKKKAEMKDPVCGMVLVESSAIGPDVVAGETYYFCSTGCQDTYHERTGTRRSRRSKETKQEPGMTH